eukprot:scaffold1813_cov109-Cylindrotheca_fusiformis.AAC.8
MVSKNKPKTAAMIWSFLMVNWQLHVCTSFATSRFCHRNPLIPLLTEDAGTTLSMPVLYANTPHGGDGSVGDEVLDSLCQKLDKSAEGSEKKKSDNKAMAFLRKMGKVGGAANKDFTNAVGSDEGAGMSAPPEAGPAIPPKSLDAYEDATETGIIDDLSDPCFPRTSSGTEWRGVSDRVKGGSSEGSIKREVVDDVTCNVLTGHISSTGVEDGGFIQMVTELTKDPSKESVDASDYDGVEMDVLSKEGLSFNVHLRTSNDLKGRSFRSRVVLECLFGWSTIRIPFSSFVDADGTSVDYSKLKRIGIVALDPGADVYLAVGGVRFYSVI